MRLAIAALAAGALLLGARQPTPSCAFVEPPLTLTAVNLPVDAPLRISFGLIPGQGEFTTPDGTYALTGVAWPARPFTAYFWQRGRGPSLVKPGPGLNDYHVIAYCTATAT